jgi:DnaA family protein
MAQLPLPVELRAETDFEEYFPGPNAEAVSAVAGWAMGGDDRFLYLFGPSGTGKTHLLQAACRDAIERQASAVYLPLACDFLSPFALDDLERSDLVALDGLQAIAGDEDWERALFSLFNRLREAGRRLIVSADTPPGELPLRLSDLRSRLAWGPSYRLRALEETDCEDLLRQSAKRRGLRLGEDAVTYIMRRCPREPRHLLEVLAKLDQESLKRKRRPTLSLVRELLQEPAP